MPAQMRVVRDDDRQIRFGNRWKWGLAICGVGLLIWYVAPLRAARGAGYWILLGCVAFAVIVGLLAYLTRDELVLDVPARRYVRRTGYWPALKEQTGPLGDFRGLLLDPELRTNPRGGQYPTWVITLQSAGIQPSIALVEFRDESEAYRKLEVWSRKLALPALENAGGREWPVESKPAARQELAELGGMHIQVLPPGSRLLFLGTAPTRTIVLPPLGLGAGALMLALFTALTLWMGIAGYSEAIHHLPPRSTHFAVGVMAFGILMFIALLFAMLGRTTIREQDDSLLIGNRAFGWNYNVKKLAKSDIEDVDIKATPLSSGAPVVMLTGMKVLRPRRRAPHPELFVRSRDQVVRIGQELSAKDLEWLRQAILSLAGS